jgi:hypothetical protein
MVAQKWRDYARAMKACEAKEKTKNCSLFDDLLWRGYHDFGLALMELNLAGNCDCVIS